MEIKDTTVSKAVVMAFIVLATLAAEKLIRRMKKIEFETGSV